MINERLSLLEGVSVMRARDVREGGPDTLQETRLKRDLFEKNIFVELYLKFRCFFFY